jgi:hypothetical protein
MCRGGDVYKVTAKPWKQSRKQRQRALANIWYGHIEQHLGETAGYAEAFCKLSWGLKIRSRDDEVRESMFRKLLDGYSYETKIDIIRHQSDMFPVLRENGGLDTEEQAEYLNAIQINFAEQGLILSTPNDDDLLRCKAANT